MAETDPDRPGLRDALGRIASTGVSLVQTRLALASVEFAEERERLKTTLILSVIAAVCGAFVLGGASLFVVAYFWDTYRFPAIAGVTLFYAGIGWFAWWKLGELHRAAPTPFATTLAELEKDRRSLGGGA
jgi:uncharacterized membrane protein YqjE